MPEEWGSAPAARVLPVDEKGHRSRDWRKDSSSVGLKQGSLNDGTGGLCGEGRNTLT